MTTIKTASNEDLQMLYKDSAFTYLGLLDEGKEYESLENYLFDTCGLERPKEVIMYKCSGKLINDEFELEGRNKLPDDLNVVFLPLENFGNQIGKLAIIKLQIGARRFDDFIENSK